tara:strand:- start:355 stop:963 length:609 start_codon:yes stop_codon:yes gene_type:complete
MKIFETKNIIPEFCFGCFKVQVEVDTFIELVKLTSIFYKFNADLTKKTFIELRSNISGFYKGLIFCSGLKQAKEVKKLLDIALKDAFDENTTSTIKRGCSEYPIKFPEYGKITENEIHDFAYPENWKVIEEKFDKTEFVKGKETFDPSLPGFCLSDFYIIQTWIDYAKGLEDSSCDFSSNNPIIFNDIYESARWRKTNFEKN